MSKITKKQLQRDIELLESGIGMNWSDMKKIETRLNHAMNEMAQQLEALEEFATYADNMLTELNHALPDPEYDAKCEASEAAVNESLDRHRERLGLNKPQLKQLDQSVFNGLDGKWRFAAVDKCGEVWYSTHKTQPTASGTHLPPIGLVDSMQAKGYYDTSNWQNSLIERDTAKELTGSDLCSELTGSDLALELLKNQRYIIASVSDVSDADAIECGNNKLIYKSSEDIFTDDMGGIYCWAVALNNQGEPLTAAEAGL